MLNTERPDVIGILHNARRGQVTHIKAQEFKELRYFIKTASDSANGSVFGKTALRKCAGTAHNEDAAKGKAIVTKRSFAVVLNNQTGVSGISTAKPGNATKQKCLLC